MVFLKNEQLLVGCKYAISTQYKPHGIDLHQLSAFHLLMRLKPLCAAGLCFFVSLILFT
jgi:hypothetical protein